MRNESNIIRTYPIKGLIIFLTIVIVLSAGFSVINYFLLKDSLALQIVIWIMCGIFFVLSLIVLLKEAIVYISVDETRKALVIHDFLVNKKIPFSEIGCIENKDGFYIFYKGKKELYRVGVDRPGAGGVMVALEKNGTKIKW